MVLAPVAVDVEQGAGQIGESRCLEASSHAEIRVEIRVEIGELMASENVDAVIHSAGYAMTSTLRTSPPDISPSRSGWAA